MPLLHWWSSWNGEAGATAPDLRETVDAVFTVATSAGRAAREDHFRAKGKPPRLPHALVAPGWTSIDEYRASARQSRLS